MVNYRFWSIVALGLCAACRGDGTGPELGRGSLSASWVGSDTGKLSAKPKAVICSDGNNLVLTAMHGDAGLGLALYPPDELIAGDYDVFDPAVDSVRRPGMSGAVRWFTDKDIPSYQSDWGTLTLALRSGAVSGGFVMHMRKVGADTDTIMLTGKFTGVVPTACVADSVSRPKPAK
jgi:hypothetical protein